MRYFLELAYNGSDFHGWQIQPNAKSVQECLENALSRITGTSIAVTGAGRTDTGVNAYKMYAHFDLTNEIYDPSKFLVSVNSLAGKDIAVRRVFKVNSEAHARFDATERTYKYIVTFSKNPFMRHLSWHSPSHLDMEKMNDAAKVLCETRDFTSFAKLHSDNKTNICDVRFAEWRDLRKDMEAFEFIGDLEGGMVFTITADRFLRNMVRAIVGTLVDVGRNKISIDDFKKIIENKDRGCAGTSMPPQALFLWDIKYPFIND